MKVACIRNTSSVSEDIFEITPGVSYDLYGTQQTSHGDSYLIVADVDTDTPQWLPAELFEPDEITPPTGWIKREKQDPTGDTITTCAYPIYFEAEQDIIGGTKRGVRLFAHMRDYPNTGFGINQDIIAEAFANAGSPTEQTIDNPKERPMKRPDEDETMYLARTIAAEVIDISTILPEVMQWRIGPALQGDVYDMSSSIAAATGSVDKYSKRDELENARSKAFVVQNAIGFLPTGRDTKALNEKINQLVVAIDQDLKTTNESIHTMEHEEDMDEA